MTGNSGTVSADARSHSALILREDDEADRLVLSDLRAAADTGVIDRFEQMHAELHALRPAADERTLAEGRRWAWYPWRRTLVALPGPLSFRRLRSDRNRNKITQAEQDRYRGLVIGVVGLSVGHSIAHTLALEGLCGGLRLADFDSIELSNLNRIPATVLDVGVNKAIATGRRVAELDPYLPVDVFPTGLTEDNIEQFFDGLALVVEECDSLDMKVRVREEARSRGIPVVMETSDRGLLDVERFDREPDRPLLHGLLGDIPSRTLRGLSTHDKAPHVMRILQTDALSARMAASMIEIDRTVSTWPQLGGDVQLGGATVAAAVRRFGRGEELSSGRIRIDLDNALDGLREGTHTTPCPDSTVDEPIPSPPDHPWDAVVHAIRLAPSGGNSQPWQLRRTPDGIDVLLARQRTSAMDVSFRGSYVAIGAAMFNAEIAAARHSMPVRITQFPDGPHADRVLAVRLSTGEADPTLAALYPAMIHRVTNRGIGRPREFTPETARALRRAVTLAGAELHLITDRSGVAALADILAESDRIRFLTPVLHRQMMDELRWPGSYPADLGIDIATLGFDASDLAKLAVARRADVMATLAEWRGAGSALGDNTRDRITASSAVAVLTVSGDSPSDYLGGGRALERMWIRAGQCHLGVHPVSPVFLYARSDRDRSSLSEEFSDELGDLQQRFRRVVGFQSTQVPVLVMRLSHDAPPAVRSRRLSGAEVMSGPDNSSVRERSA